jgi:hypothetical protein
LRFFILSFFLHILKSNNCYEGKKKMEKILRYLADVCSSPSVKAAIVALLLHQTDRNQ